MEFLLTLRLLESSAYRPSTDDVDFYQTAQNVQSDLGSTLTVR